MHIQERYYKHTTPSKGVVLIAMLPPVVIYARIGIKEYQYTVINKPN